ncbi:MAG: hypothetical protein KDI82_15940 [Gammaproteobacteria bacterium]|nr:hypothetical protein [Gammaproteobacteria bacterium]
MTTAAGQRRFRVFYRDYANEVSISSAQPESLAADRVAPLAERLLVDADNFLGVVDASDTILQCYLADDPGQVTCELVYPEATGCLRCTMSLERSLALLGGLPEAFSETLLPGAQYID